MSSKETADSSAGIASLEIPRESAMLHAAYKKSGLSVADLAAATGISTSTIQIALKGVRYREGQPRATVPPDSTLVKLASVLRIHPDVVKASGRERAAQLLQEFSGTNEQNAITPAEDLDAKALLTGRNTLAKQILAAFSTQELQDEVERRQDIDNDAYNREIQDEIRDDLRSDQYPL